MTDWITYFRVLTHHCRGHCARIDPRIVVKSNDAHTNQMADRFYMVTMPAGGANTSDLLAEEWMKACAA